MRRPLFTGVLAIAMAIGPSRQARASDPVAAAEAAYDAATQAHGAGDFALAARMFARADELAPNAVALETALREAVLADLPALGMNLVLRAAREVAPSHELGALVVDVKARFGLRVGFLEVRCASCLAELAGEPVPIGVAIAIEPGNRAVRLTSGGAVEIVDVLIESGVTRLVTPTVAASAPHVPPKDRAEPEAKLDGAHPAWITMGIAGTAALGGAAIASYVDAVALESELEAKRQARDTQGAQELADRGRAAEVRMYVFEGLCAGSGIATLFVGIFVIDWDGPSARPGRPAPAAPKVRLSPASVRAMWQF